MESALSGPIIHPELGEVVVSRRRNMVNIVARWRGGCLHVNVPFHLDHRRLTAFLDANTAKLLACRTDVSFADGDSLAFTGLRVDLVSQTVRPDAVTVSAALPVSVVGVGSEVGFDNVALISKAMVAVAHAVGADLLFPRAEMIASRIGVSPSEWRLSRSARTLGSCSASGVITLSAWLVFLPLHLRDYIVCHELAHLTEMNHSAAFHRLCNRYCSGREAMWRAELRRFRWPVTR